MKVSKTKGMIYNQVLDWNTKSQSRALTRHIKKIFKMQPINPSLPVTFKQIILNLKHGKLKTSKKFYIKYFISSLYFLKYLTLHSYTQASPTWAFCFPLCHFLNDPACV